MRPHSLIFLLFSLLVCCFYNCQTAETTFTDSRDQTVYRTKKINDVTWMLDNLQFSTDSSWCVNNDSGNCENYGRLYTWNDALQACPNGWRLPTQDEWMDLSLHLAGEEWHKKDGGENRLFRKLKPGGESDFELSLAGMYDPETNYFFPIGSIGSYWSSTKFAYHAAICAVMDGRNGEIFMINPGTRAVGHSCRCIKTNH